MARTFSIATRASPLAVCQAEWVAAQLRARGHDCNLVKTSTSGDDGLATAEGAEGAEGKEAFVDRVRGLVVDGHCDLAVHSLKDLPVQPEPLLCLIAVPERAPAQDVLVSRRGGRLQDLPPGAQVGTASLRRQALLRAVRPDLEVVSLRGNVGTRLNKMERGECDALILARAGLERLGCAEIISEELALDEWTCSPGQGALAVECRTSDAAKAGFAADLRVLQHEPTRLCTEVERAFSARMGADCRAPLGAWCRLEQRGGVRLAGFVGSASCEQILRDEDAADVGLENADVLGRRLAERMLKNGAAALLQSS